MGKFTFTIGPCVGIPAIGDSVVESLSTERRGLNAAILCDTPSANINFSRNSMFVRPLAIFYVDFMWVLLSRRVLFFKEGQKLGWFLTGTWVILKILYFFNAIFIGDVPL